MTAIVLDPTSAVPVYRQIYAAWRDGILAGRFSGGSRVPSTRELAATLGVARSTVTQAYEQLVAEGYLRTTHGAGTFVSHELPDAMLQARATARAAVPSISIALSRFGTRIEQAGRTHRRASGRLQLSRLTPDVEQFPVGVWHRLLRRHMRASSHAMFDYAHDAAGFAPLRQEIAAYVARARAVRCTPDQVIVVNGSQQGLDLCARLLLDPGQWAAVENPGYTGARQVFSAAGAQLQPVDVDDEGMQVAMLQPEVRLVHVTPSHQFPTGAAMSLPRRLALADWARRHRAIVIEDDYDSEFRYSGSPLPALQGLAADAPVIYCGTFSKVMFAGLRIGYLVVPPNLADAFEKAKWLADRHTPMLEQAALADFLAEGHLERHIRRMRSLYGRRRQVLIDGLIQNFGDRATIIGDAAGMHLLARIDDPGLPQRALAHGVQLTSAAGYYLTAQPANEFLFGFAALGERTIRVAVRRLAVERA